jgi:hypothetical protein
MSPAGVAQAESLLDRWGLHPKYATSYEVNRTRETWQQTLDFRRTLGGVNLSSKTRWVVTNNSAQNDYRAVRAASRLSLDTKWLGSTVGLDLDIRRDRANNVFSSTRDHRTTLGLRWEFPVDLPLLDPIKVKTVGGYAEDLDFNRRNKGGGARTDSSWARGATWETSLQTSGSWWEGMSYRVNGRLAGSDEKSRTVSLEQGEMVGDIRDRNQDRSREMRFNMTWDPKEEWKASVDGTYRFNRFEYFDFEVEQPERKDGTQRNLSGKLQGVLRPGLEFKLTATHDATIIDYEVKERDTYKRKNGLKSEWTLKPSWGWIRGLEAKAELEWTGARTEPQSAVFYGTRERRAKLRVQKDLGKGVDVAGTAEVRLRQDFYDDGSRDKDEVQRTWDGTLNYTPSRRFSARISYRIFEREIVNIRSDFSGSNNTSRQYRVQAKYSYMLRPRVRLAQTFSISADYTFYHFQKDNNTLARTNEVQTDIEAALGSRSKLRFSHFYRFSDSGSYAELQGGGGPVYRPSSERVRQYLTVETEYRIAGSISLKATESLELSTTRAVGSGSTNRTKRLEFSGEAKFEHEFSKGFRVKGTFRRTESNFEDSYWVVKASLNRDF